jgi:site-specific DNA-cytosine methylase
MLKDLCLATLKDIVKLIFEQLKRSGYTPQMFLINAAFCNVPQARERVFIIAQRNDLNKPLLQINTNNKTISVQQSFNTLNETKVLKHYLSGRTKQLWHLTKQGKSFADSCKKLNGKSSWFNSRVIHPDLPAPTITAACNAYHWEEPRRLTENENCRTLTSNATRCTNLPNTMEQTTPKTRQTPLQRRLQKKARQIRDTAVACWICGQGKRPNDPFTADHLIPADPNSPLAAAHRSCNSRRQNKPITSN